MNLLPAALVRPKRQAPVRSEPDISTAMAVALSLLAVIAVFIVGEAYLSRVVLTVDERSALLNTLLLCDVMAFSFSMLITAILWYLSSIRYGSRERRGMLGSNTLAPFGILMALPIIFIACDLSFKPAFFSSIEAEIALALSAVGIISLIPYSIGLLEYVRPRGVLMGFIEDIRLQFEKAGREGPVEPAALQRPVLRSDAGMGLASMLDKLCRMGDFEPVIRAMEEMKRPALAPQKSARSMALASSMVSMMAETAGIAARYEGHEVVYRALDGLSDVAISSPHQGTSSLAFRSMGSVFNVCSTGMGERELSRLVTKMIESYTAVYDRAGRHEALELAAAMVEKAADTRMFATEEYDGVLYVSGGVYRRLAEAGDSEEYANKSLTALFEALTARTAEASPIDHACIKGEIGRAYMALAKAKNPVKNYRSAAQTFEDAGRMLEAKVSPWDSALYRGKAACAYTFLADEFCRGKRYDDAIQAARSALALYPEAVKFFERRSLPDYVDALSNMGFAHTIVSEVYLKSRMFDLSLKHATNALDAYSKVTKAVDPVAAPERYAFMKTIMGLTHVNMAEIHFREKRYENAISSCDSAIAAYNEAIRIYDDKGKEKPASAARKHLKKANDLFSTMMRIGVADKKPLAPVAEQ